MERFTYTRAVKFLDDSLIFGIKPNLLRINKILELMGDPHKNPGLDFIHIVGTNGKTSTTIMTARILYGHGLRTAYHTSPHINEYYERLWCCGKTISKNEFAKLFTEIYPFIEEVNRLNLNGPITQFEIIAAMAFWLCFREKIQVMVLEAGMGGRWDATNAADSKIVGLTGVSLEHTAVLGRTIRQIATEKSMVIKKGSVVATTSKDETVMKVLKERVLKTGSKLFLYEKDFYLTSAERIFLKGWNVSLKTAFGNLNDVFLPLIGDYQPQNFALAAVLSELYLHQISEKISEDEVRKTMSSVRVQGRFEILKTGPLVIADTSHNPEGLKNFMQNLTEITKYNQAGDGLNYAETQKPKKISKIIIFSVLKDKDYRQMLSLAAINADILILTSSNTSRSLGIDDMEKELEEIMFNKKQEFLKLLPVIYKIDSVINSLNFALKIAANDDIICITGSITNLERII